MKSDKTLKRWYNTINKKFFGGELPKDVCVQWGDSQEDVDYEDVEGCYGLTELADDGRHKFVILLNRERCYDQISKLNTLIHEMIHVRTECKDDHGPVFNKYLQELVDKGIFKKGALLKQRLIF